MPGTIHTLFREDDESDYDVYESIFDDTFESYDDSDYDSWDESSSKKLRPQASTPFVNRPAPKFRPSPALATAKLPGAGPKGMGQVKFDRPVATAAALEQLKNETRRAIAEVRQETKTNLGRLDSRLKDTATQVEKIGKTSTARMSALEQRSQLFALMPLLQGKPKAKVTFIDSNGAQKESEVKYDDDKMSMMLPLLLMGGLGGTPGTPGGQDSSMMMMMALAFMN